MKIVPLVYPLFMFLHRKSTKWRRRRRRRLKLFSFYVNKSMKQKLKKRYHSSVFSDAFTFICSFPPFLPLIHRVTLNFHERQKEKSKRTANFRFSFIAFFWDFTNENIASHFWFQHGWIRCSVAIKTQTARQQNSYSELVHCRDEREMDEIRRKRMFDKKQQQK